MPASASPKVRKVFDYTSIDAETSLFVRQHTGEIRALMKRTAQTIIEIGQKLTSVKEKLGHGRFLDWLEAEFAWSESTATKFMQVDRQFKFVNLTDLDVAPSALYVLAAPSTPNSARAEAIARAEAGESITYKTAKVIKQKHAPSPPLPKPEPISETQPTPTPAPPPESRSKLEIVAIHPQGQAPARTPEIIREEATRDIQVPQAAMLSVPQPSHPVYAPEQPGIWWQLGERHLLYCGEPNSPEILGRITEEASLLLAFPPTLDWKSGIRARTTISLTTQHSPQGHDLIMFGDMVELMLLLYSNVGDLVVSCFLPSPEIISIVNRLGRRGLLAEPDKGQCHEVISNWKKAGLKAERIS